jgi:D-aminopeptidase
MNHSKTDAIAAILARHARSDAPGVVASVSLHGNSIYRGAVGLANVEHGVALTPATKMPIGSVTKQFTCAAVLLLADEGKLSLDDPIARWIPELCDEQRLPTLRQLMSHTAGVRCYLDLAILDGYGALPPGAAIRRQLRQRSLNFEPGTGASYSNGGYLLLSLAVERAAGLPFERFLSERIFGPLDMRSTSLPRWRWPLQTGVATTYLASGKDWRHGLCLTEEFLGEGGMVSTADDLLRWAAALRCGFGPVTLEALTTSTLLRSGSATGYGFGLITETWRGIRTVQHAGGLPGASAAFVMLPESGVDIAVALNRSGSATGLALEIAEALVGGDLAPSPTVPAASTYAGMRGHFFCEDTGFVFGFADMAGHLGLSLFGAPPFELESRPAEAAALPLFADVGLGEIRFRIQGSPVDAVDVVEYLDAGTWRPAHRLPEPRPRPIDIAAATMGVYESEDLCASFRFDLEDGRLVMRCRGEFGSQTCNAEPWGPDLVRFWPSQWPAACLRGSCARRGASRTSS